MIDKEDINKEKYIFNELGLFFNILDIYKNYINNINIDEDNKKNDINLFILPLYILLNIYKENIILPEVKINSEIIIFKWDINNKLIPIKYNIVFNNENKYMIDLKIFDIFGDIDESKSFVKYISFSDENFINIIIEIINMTKSILGNIKK